MDDICVIGLGYIGLPTALMLAAHGGRVIGVDIDASLIEKLNKGEVTFQEDGLEDLLSKSMKGNIIFTTKYAKTSFYILAVPTPFDKYTKKIAPSYVIKAINNVLDVCSKGAIIVIESTVSPGTIDKYVRPAIKSRGINIGQDIHLVHAPERIIPGSMIRELRENSRVIGADDYRIGEAVRQVYTSFCAGEIVITDIRTAEMTKVVENTYRDINIAYANELAKICRQDNLNVYEIIKTANMHPRVNILNPGPGVGGHCISVDPWFLVGDYPGLSLLIHEARKINDSMPGFVLRRIHDIMEEKELSDTSRIGFYGIAYKEDVDDTRESPTLQLYDIMKLNLGGEGVKFFDPMCNHGVLPGQTADFDKFIDSCDLIVIMVGHSHIRQNMSKLSGKIVLDTRNVCDLHGCYKL